MKTITEHEYSSFQHAYDFFNQRLFDGELPQVLITLQRHPKAKGYFSPERFASRDQETKVHELAMNPDTFETRSDEEIISTLVHEMVHVWEQEKGTAPRRCYHNKIWAEKMELVGLIPTDTGLPGGKRTGQFVTHYIEEGGPYQRLWEQLKASAFELNWQSANRDLAKASKKAASKTKYTCPSCAQNAWAKPETTLICGKCHEENGDIELMQAA